MGEGQRKPPVFPRVALSTFASGEKEEVICISPRPLPALRHGEDHEEGGDIIARAQGKHEGNLTMLPTDSMETCNKEENASNLVTMKSSNLPEMGFCENPPDVTEVILDLRKTQEESVVAQENVPLEQALGEKGKGRISVKNGLLLRKIPEEENLQGAFCKQFAAIHGCGSDLIESAQGESLYRESNSLFGSLVSVPNCQSLSEVYRSTKFALEKPSVDHFEKVLDGMKIVREFERPYDQVAVLDRLVGKTMLLGQECLHIDSLSEQSVTQVLRKDLVMGFSEQNSFITELTRMQGRAGKLSPLGLVYTCKLECIKSAPGTLTPKVSTLARHVEHSDSTAGAPLVIHLHKKHKACCTLAGVMQQSLNENQKAQEWRETERRLHQQNADCRHQSTEQLISIVERQVDLIQVLIALQTEQICARRPLQPLSKNSFLCVPMSPPSHFLQHAVSYHHQLLPTPVASPPSPANYDPYPLHSTPITMHFSQSEVQHATFKNL
ncbi:hypothetical protein UY3_12665 [Chelonia mydas]|uniref:Uncharacterized protein n=1 Tax=Chelonia mydas TaxID=8469 RepID=M7B410_CHEMY|nr:hypothetical protein UY3_12665 [Chelonia mydas]